MWAVSSESAEQGSSGYVTWGGFPGPFQPHFPSCIQGGEALATNAMSPALLNHETQ